MISTPRLKRARDQIVGRFIAQCQHGPQVKNLPENVLACGQYLGSDSPQRGIHGTAAAVRVLGGREEGNNLVGKLIAYLDSRTAIERQVRAPEDFAHLEKGLELDERNVIKLSEQLVALHYVTPNQASKEQLQKRLAQQLQAACHEESGWRYFTDNGTAGFDPLPTAFAIRALSLGGYPVGKQAAKLWQAIRTARRLPESIDRADATVRLFCLFVLAFGNLLGSTVTNADVRRSFWELWRSHEALLFEDMEQNIEYFHGEDHLYVRVPWQIYLLALAAKLAPYKAFASVASQRRLDAILKAVDSDPGFIYPHSGTEMSSRTNAILYDALALIDEELGKQPITLLPALVVDRIRSVISSVTMRVIFAMVAALIAGLALRDWWRHGSVGEIAPELIAPALVLLMTLGKHRA